MTPPPIDVLGLPVHPVDLAGLLDAVAEQVGSGGRCTVAYLNVHVANVAATNPDLARFLKEDVDICYCDGAGVVLGARLLGHELPGRLTGADWIWDLAGLCVERGWRLFWMGGEPGVTAEAAAKLRARHPALDVVTDHGFHQGPEAELALVERINAAGPHLLLVGMGTPVQELWVARWRASLEVPVVWCLGATADFVSGRVSRGPAFLHRRAEWLARLLTEPQRLWKRYLLGNPRFLARVVRKRVLG